jgi:NAD(P)-dependent dehydrogenase (short-subunit alcohol dehydrogenase family)
MFPPLSMQGKTVLITGASDGIGKETARAIASLGAATILVGRNSHKTGAVVKEIELETGSKHIEMLIADLSSTAEVHRLAREFLGRHDRLDVLINNAGAVFMDHQVSADGYEMTLALNHLGPFQLTHLLMGALKASPSARVVNVTSEAHRGTHLDFNNLQNERGYNSWRAYGQSKLANIYFTYALAAYLDGLPIYTNCLHPGFVASNFGRSNGGIYDPVFRLAHFVAISPKISAQAVVNLAASPELEGVTARYFNRTKEARSSEISYDMNIAKTLWDVSLKLTGLAQSLQPYIMLNTRLTDPARK